MTDDLLAATRDHRVVHEHACDCAALRAAMRDLAESLRAEGDRGTAARVLARMGQKPPSDTLCGDLTGSEAQVGVSGPEGGAR